MKYQEAMKYITEVGNFGSSYGLERTYKLLELLDNPQDKLKIIHVAGKRFYNCYDYFNAKGMWL